ncbi:MAG: energy transducer TonB, partial [Candidatus Eremiobacteraeota bacterium]|nr:energy transducer TonB [Candidatus Eremiobacteraeota bacterium]
MPSSSSLGGIALGSSFITAVRAHGLPSTVLTSDVGHIFTWEDSKTKKLRLTVDDDGIVRMIDVLPVDSANPSFTVPSDPPLHVAFGKFTVEQSEEKLSSFADFSGVGAFPDTGAKAEFRAYKLAPQIELMLLFDNGNILREALLGQRSTLALNGLLPGVQIKAPHFSAPVLQHEGSADYPRTRHQGDAILRIAVDTKGKVIDTLIVVSTGDRELD